MQVTDCAPGEYILAGPSTSTDRVCGDCNGTTNYQNEVNKFFCKPVVIFSHLLPLLYFFFFFFFFFFLNERRGLLCHLRVIKPLLL